MSSMRPGGSVSSPRVTVIPVWVFQGDWLRLNMKTFRESELSRDVSEELSVTGGMQGVTDALLNRRLKGIRSWTG